MAAPVPDAPGEAASSSSRGAPRAQREARYHFLVGRLRSRQITMEEATELFALMEAMLRESEVARRAVATLPARPAGPAAPARPATPGLAASGGADDLLLVGLLAMGAGAGLLAAMSRRLAEGPLPKNDADPRAASRRAS